ncbi:DNA-binding response regulator [Listeria newyorkensis]|uniref:DNA-binding response regulator n=1 Tax=Listeria newyorkensis TaxID=1497681 RepID=A0A841YTP3_9LIST|nr:MULTISPECIES: response regulator transcription factor [Listeria]KMT61723.1 putative two-component response regulator [Listeria newyorkensis]MBC1456770.1 response regulator transcription factor [Listeria newyorkensis]PNP95037.1 DNA-binding response regulator [Listeria newyorkensis]RQW66423.1 DNA-binding response regulator [Listeria sp. SHR_NRA_18]WAO21969.1 response regulator transcription factor [Listeria newyorkensis]
MTSILIADDDKEIVDLVKLYLQNEGYTIYYAYDGAQVWETVQKEQLDLVVLDIMMPKMDGLEVCRLMRQEGITTPILMLSAKAEDNDKIMGLLTGADDYMVKPFNPLELSVRVKAILRRVQLMRQGNMGSTPLNQLILGPIVIDRELHTVMVNEKDLHLTTSEFDILFLLANEPGRVFSSELIFERIWQEKALGASKTVMVHISNLRDKLKDAMDGENVIKTIWGVGYKIEV